MQYALGIRNICSMQIRKKRHACSADIAIKEMSSWGCKLTLRVMEQFYNAYYCMINLLYNELKACSSERLNQQYFPAVVHPSQQTVLTFEKRLKKIGSVTNRAWWGRPAKIRQQVQPDKVWHRPSHIPNAVKGRSVNTVAFQRVRNGKFWALNISTGFIRQKCRECYAWCNFLMNLIQV